MFEGFEVRVSADGRRMVARKYGNKTVGSSEPQASFTDAPKDSAPVIGAIVLSTSRPNVQDYRAK